MASSNGKGSFTLDRRQMNVIRDNKAVVEIAGTNGSSMFLISSNSDSLHAYRLNKRNHKMVSINPDDTYASTTFLTV